MSPETLSESSRGSDAGGAEELDVLIIGAGLSGIGLAHHLQERCPGKSYAILEAREAIGGTWDLFRYPGVRSDSDMHTLGYGFRPWTTRSIADGESILQYVRDAARDGGIDRKVRFGHRVVSASWSSEEAAWTVTAEREDGSEAVFKCGFLASCCGYYRYDQGYTPEFEGIEDFEGRVIHPQHWPEEPGYAGKRVVVIGSGATAVTLVPAMAKDAAHVTMLQRSPSYILSVPSVDPMAELLRKVLSPRAVHAFARWKSIKFQNFTYRVARNRPDFAKKVIRKGVMSALPEGYDVDTHFKPNYDPWDQRLCLIPDGDLFKAISDGSAEVVTDRIERFTPKGIKLESGQELEADVVVTATGLQMIFLGGIELTVDGEKPEPGGLMTYKGVMFAGVPNLATMIGYTHASWTLKIDLVAEYLCRVINHMDAAGYDVCVARLDDPTVAPEPILDFSSGYVVRAVDELPKQGSKEPWQLRQNYAIDRRTLQRDSIEDGAIHFSRRAGSSSPVRA